MHLMWRLRTTGYEKWGVSNGHSYAPEKTSLSLELESSASDLQTSTSSFCWAWSIKGEPNELMANQNAGDYENQWEK